MYLPTSIKSLVIFICRHCQHILYYSQIRQNTRWPCARRALRKLQKQCRGASLAAGKIWHISPLTLLLLYLLPGKQECAFVTEQESVDNQFIYIGILRSICEILSAELVVMMDVYTSIWEPRNLFQVPTIHLRPQGGGRGGGGLKASFLTPRPPTCNIYTVHTVSV